MLVTVLKKFGIKLEVWKLQGWDTFAGEPYALAGLYFSEKSVRKAAKKELKKLEKLQPARYSGGQKPDGIQDQIHIVRPDGSTYRFLLEEL